MSNKSNWVNDYNNASPMERARYEQNRENAQRMTMDAILERHKQEKAKKLQDEAAERARWDARMERWAAEEAEQERLAQEDEYRRAMYELQERLVYDQLSPEGKAKFDADKRAAAELVRVEAERAETERVEAERKRNAERAERERANQLRLEYETEQRKRRSYVVNSIVYGFFGGIALFVLLGAMLGPFGIFLFLLAVVFFFIKKPWIARSQRMEARRLEDEKAEGLTPEEEHLAERLEEEYWRDHKDDEHHANE